MPYFVRIATKPEKDMIRGVSYPMGSFGDEGEEHAGLSGYSMSSRSLEGALEELDHRMGAFGEFQNRNGRAVKMYLAVFKGREVGTGPDGEELFSPSEMLLKIPTKSAESLDAMIALVRAAMPDEVLNETDRE